mgnify:CR=1 FL=1|jgi:hypothetical protein
MKSPKHTTHVKIDTVFEGRKQSSVMDIKDMDCIAGCAGKVSYLRLIGKREPDQKVDLYMHGNKYKVLGVFKFDGEWPIKKEETETIVIKIKYI